MSTGKLIRDIQVQEGFRFNERGGVVPTVVYSFFVGTHGPFTLHYDKGVDSPEKVQADMDAQVLKLRSVGAIGPAEV